MDQLTTTIDQPLAQVETAIRRALADQGFGILSEIDVAQVLFAKLGVERAPLKILGACNPALVNAALEHDPSVALALPCNVVLSALSDTVTTVSIADPATILPGADVADLVTEARQRLGTALASLSPGPTE